MNETPQTSGQPTGNGTPSPGVPVMVRTPEVIVVLITLAALAGLFFLVRSMGNGSRAMSASPATGTPPAAASTAPSSGAMPRDQLKLPGTFDSLVMMGHTLMDQQNFAVASEAYARAIRMDSSDVDLIVDYGACLHGLGMPDRALQEFRRALKRAPNHPIAHFNMGIVHLSLSHLDSAQFYWKRYLSLEPNGPGADRARELIAKNPLLK